ncbi:MAG: hypothetical protein FWD23_18605 [Oscillospiraceae bacterium]|nr:hypothetical protein [Oscillospiraceae bacterium]
MIKLNIAAFIFISLGVLGMAGCNSNSSIFAEGDITSLKISYSGSGMMQYTDYNYYIREENGEILFDAHFYIVGEDVRKITLEKISSAQEDMEALRDICDEYDFARTQKKAPVYKVPFWRKIMGNHISDGPVGDVILEITWENGAALAISPDNMLNLLNFLKELAIRLEN